MELMPISPGKGVTAGEAGVEVGAGVSVGVGVSATDSSSSLAASAAGVMSSKAKHMLNKRALFIRLV